MVPLDVEILGLGRGFSLFQHVHEKCILGVKRLVVRDDVLHPTHPELTAAGEEIFELLLRSKLRIQSVGIDDVISMRPLRAANTGDA